MVGAAHVKGIQSRWAQAGSPETERQVAEYCGAGAISVPTNAGPWIDLAAGICSWPTPLQRYCVVLHELILLGALPRTDRAAIMTASANYWHGRQESFKAF